MEILTVGIVWIALALIVATLLRFAEMVLVVGVIAIVCMLIHSVYTHRRKK